MFPSTFNIVASLKQTWHWFMFRYCLIYSRFCYGMMLSSCSKQKLVKAFVY